MTELDESDLVSRARAGGKDGVRAYDELVRRHQGRALRLATYLLGDSADGEDIAQEAFVRAFTNLPRANADTSFGAWLRTIVTRLCFNQRRNRKVRATSELDPEQAGSLPSSTRTAVEWTLNQLSYPYREVLILRFVEGMSVEEIAETLDVGLSAAKMRLARARDKFSAIYEQEHHAPPPETVDFSPG
jgi:RNA polymerase sigma-70 factor, ECF subfamily